MIALRLSADPETKRKFRVAAIRLSARSLFDAGMVAASVRVSCLEPRAVRRLPYARAHVSISASAEDAGEISRASRRSGLRYVAMLLRAAGTFLEEARYLDRLADAIVVGGQPDDGRASLVQPTPVQARI